MNKKIFGFIIALIIVFSPIPAIVNVAHAEGGIVPSCNTGPLVLKLDSKNEPIRDSKGQLTNEKGFKNPCDFDDVMFLINNIIEFLLFYLATPLAAIALCYAGFLLLFSGGSSEKVTKAKKIIKNVIIGYILALAGWLIVKTILVTLGFKGETFLK